jgi:hypothetical protein
MVVVIQHAEKMQCKIGYKRRRISGHWQIVEEKTILLVGQPVLRIIDVGEDSRMDRWRG